MSNNNYRGKKCVKPETNDTLLNRQPKVGQRFITRLRTGTAKVFRTVKEHLSPMSSDSVKRLLVTTTVTTKSTTKIVTTRERSTTTIQTTTTTASTTKVANGDSVKINPTLVTSTTIKSIAPSDITDKVSKTTKTTTTTTTTTTTNINPTPKTTTTYKKTKTHDSKTLKRPLYRNRRHVMLGLH